MFAIFLAAGYQKMPFYQCFSIFIYIRKNFVNIYNIFAVLCHIHVVLPVLLFSVTSQLLLTVFRML